MKAKQGYLGGMDQDTAFNKRNPNTYYSAHNFRIMTNEGNSSGSLVSEKGTELSFTVPTIPSMTLGDGTVIPTQANLQIIGSTTMVDEIIIFTTNQTSEAPSGYGQVWQLKYDEATDSIIGLTVNGELDPAVHLKYNNALNFSTEYRIGRAVALYETTNKQRVYWTDNYNPVRTLNLSNTDVLDTPLTQVNLFPGVGWAQPVVKSIGTGSLPTQTKIQFSYRLLSSDGGTSVCAPASPMLPLTSTLTNAPTFGEFDGSGGSNQANKSVTYEITDIDTSFDAIQHIAVLYSNTDTRIFIFREENIPSSGYLEVTCSSLSDAIEMTIEEYNLLTTGFDTCKDIEVQGNRLVAANIKASNFDIDFDARAYRFNSNTAETDNIPRSRPGNSANPSTDFIEIVGGISPNFSNIPEEYDAVNIYNKEQEITWASAVNQYKYQADGITLGGEGPNIKYEFTIQQFPANYNIGLTTVPDHVKVDAYPENVSPLYLGNLDKDGNPQPIYRGNQFSNFASPWAHQNVTGYARGEVYRFGIVFYNLNGTPSFVKWIGDIKFPDVSDGYHIQELVGGYPQMNSLGIRFTVDISSIEDQISGYSIVRLERDEDNRTRLGTGIWMNPGLQSENSGNTLIHTFDQTYGGLIDSSNPYPLTSNFNYAGQPTLNAFHLPDKPGFVPHPLVGTVKDYGYLVGPINQLYGLQFKPGDYIETLSYYGATLANYDQEPSGGGSDNQKSYGFWYKCMQQELPVHTKEKFQVEQLAFVNPGEVVVDPEFIKDLPSSLYIMNATYSRYGTGSNDEHPLGIGSPKLIVKLYRAGMTSPHTTSALNMTWNYNANGNALGWDASPGAGPSSAEFITWSGSISNSTPKFKIVGYRRYLEQQYGGDNFETRSADQYLYIGHYQPTKDVTGTTNLSFSVFGGDTYVNYYDDEYAEQYRSFGVQSYKEIFKEPGNNKVSLAACFPVESPVNTNFRYGRHWASDRDGDDMGAYISNEYLYTQLYNQSDITSLKFYSKDFLADFNTEHFAQLWASDIKINGELVDSWRSFPEANKIDVDAIYGPINRIISHKDTLHFYQDRAFGIAALDEKSVIQDQTGAELVLGTGGVFPDYRYISTNTGSIHQFGVVKTENAIYHYDARLKKFYMYSGGANPVSDIKGMSSFFDHKVQGIIRNTDKTLRVENDATGVHGIYDIRHNRVLFTFLNTEGAPDVETFSIGNDTYTIPADTYFNLNGITYWAPNGFTAKLTGPTQAVYYQRPIGFTIGFNEVTQTFEAFYDYQPGMYLEYGRRLFSVSPFNKNKMYLHNMSDTYAKYYDILTAKPRLNTILATQPDFNKIFNNIEYNAELYDINNNDVYNETFSTVRFYSNYQDTGIQDLIVDQNIKRRMRTWRTTIPRDQSEPLSRMRNHWLQMELEYNNTNGYRHVLHEILYSFTPANL